ncbi:UBA-like_superfamily [Hexamita inflata]|uniref:UBA-like superfamily n=1 Tax=Hexamita inflata TaxID=28002 RepID=A0AA86TFN4_9EUKA|nr:UBA-like superfamily [Hexamita inflata]
MQGNIQQFMDITNSSDQMAVYYLRQLQGNLEHAVAQFYEDDMPKKVESFVRQTGSTKIRAEIQLTRNGNEQRENTLQKAVNQQLKFLQRRGIQPRIYEDDQNNNQGQYQQLPRQEQPQVKVQPAVQKIIQVIEKPNEPEPEPLEQREQTPIYKEQYIVEQNLEELTEEEPAEVQKNINKEQTLQQNNQFTKQQCNNGNIINEQNIQQYNINYKIIDEVQEYQECSQQPQHFFQPNQSVSVQKQNQNNISLQIQNCKQQYNQNIPEQIQNQITCNQQQQQVRSNNQVFGHVNDQAQLQNMFQASQTHSNLQQDEFQNFQISYDSILKQIEINNAMFAQLFGDQTQSQTQSKQPEPVKQNYNVAQTIISKESVIQNQIINDQMTTINKRNSSKSIVLPDSESSSFTIDIESSEDQQTQVNSQNQFQLYQQMNNVNQNQFSQPRITLNDNEIDLTVKSENELEHFIQFLEQKTLLKRSVFLSREPKIQNGNIIVCVQKRYLDYIQEQVEVYSK